MLGVGGEASLADRLPASRGDNQPQRALLDEVRERHAPSEVPPRHADGEVDVRLDKPGLRTRVAPRDPPSEVGLFLGA
jgi:hypothetical protein